MFLLCLIALGSRTKSDAGTYTVNSTSAPHFLHSGAANATVPVSMVSLNTSQASEASLGHLATIMSKPQSHFSQHIPEVHGKEKEMRVRHSYKNSGVRGAWKAWAYFRIQCTAKGYLFTPCHNKLTEAFSPEYRNKYIKTASLMKITDFFLSQNDSQNL